MGAAWRTGSKKAAAEKYVIYRFMGEDNCLVYETAGLTGEIVRRVARSHAEHEVCSGAARYMDLKP